jgi:ATP-dependent Lhr-like helicase
MDWRQLRSIQVEAIHSIIDDSNHVIISAMTASGKTEAAFLPILSQIADDYKGSVRAIYVGPLKALINDQFRPY